LAPTASSPKTSSFPTSDSSSSTKSSVLACATRSDSSSYAKESRCAHHVCHAHSAHSAYVHARLRDMSVIETPPRDRLAIQTVVATWDEKLIRSSIEQELERGGQAISFITASNQSLRLRRSCASWCQKPAFSSVTGRWPKVSSRKSCWHSCTMRQTFSLPPPSSKMASTFRSATPF